MKKTYGDPVKPARCLECGDRLMNYRSNKKFCTVKCKNDYYNKALRQKRKYKAWVGKQVEINYNILSGILSKGEHSAELHTLAAQGFNSSFITSCIRTGAFVCYTCIDISFRISDTKVFNIHRMSLNLP